MPFFKRMKIGDRIRQRREELNLSQDQLGALVGVGQTAVAAWEVGRNSPKNPTVALLSRALQTTPNWLLFGQTDGLGNKVPLRGFVGTGEVVTALPDDVVEYVDGPPVEGKPLEALEIRGTSMAPAYKPGDLVYYEAGNSYNPGDQIGEECVVELATGEIYLKRIFHGSKTGLFTLTSYNGVPIEDVKIRSCAPVLWVRRKRR